MKDDDNLKFEDGKTFLIGADFVCTEFMARMADPENVILLTQFEAVLERYQELKKSIESVPNSFAYIGCRLGHHVSFQELETKYQPAFIVFIRRSLMGPALEYTTFSINEEKKITGVVR